MYSLVKQYLCSSFIERSSWTCQYKQWNAHCQYYQQVLKHCFLQYLHSQSKIIYGKPKLFSWSRVSLYVLASKRCPKVSTRNTKLRCLVSYYLYISFLMLGEFKWINFYSHWNHQKTIGFLVWWFQGDFYRSFFIRWNCLNIRSEIKREYLIRKSTHL